MPEGEFRGRYYYKYNAFYDDVAQLAKYCIAQNLGPHTLLIGLARGGLVPAVMLSHALGYDMCSIEWSLRDNKTPNPHNEEALLKCVSSHSNIIVVDDICDRGTTLESLYGVIRMAQGHTDNLTSCVLWANTKSTFVPDVWVHSINRDHDKRFIVFPWEAITEKVCTNVSIPA